MASFLDKLKSPIGGKTAKTPKAPKTPKDPNAKPGTINLPNFDQIKNNFQDKINKHPAGREINLVPDVKNEMIKALKLRNFTFFLCIVVSSISLALTLVFASIAGGQQAIADGKKNTITNLSAKINSYSDLSDYLTIKDQLANLNSISSNKKLLSRTFSVLSALIPTGADTIKISELNINLANGEPAISFDAQADSGTPPYIDYNVLDSFKKSMQYMRYDYGTYVDKEGAEIPAYCIIENGSDGATFSDPERGYYAYWLIKGTGCNPSYEPKLDKDGNEVYNEADVLKGYTTEEYEGNQVVRIWRTPQYNDWYKEIEKDGQPYMSIVGEIANVPHFESECISYFGIENENTKEITWSSENNDCLLVPDGTNGIIISDSSNGRGSSDELVLRFSASIILAPEVYNYNNHHMMAIAPSGRYNVTDSYVQIQSMFSERATDCAPGDTACNNTTNGGNNG